MALAVLLVVAIPVGLAVVLFADDSQRDVADGVAPEAATRPDEPSDPIPSPTSGPTTDGEAQDDDAQDDDAGGIDGLLEDLLGGMDPTALAACMGTPSGVSEPAPDDVQAAIDQIVDQVVAERGLELSEPIDPTLLTPDELRARIVELTERDYPPEAAALDARLLVSLGAIPRGTDLQELQLDLLGGQVAGFYDPDTGELTAIAADGLDPTTRITLAHEIDHALADQAIGLPDLDGFEGRSDEGLATLAVIEGDASLLMQRWAMQHLSLLDQLGAAAASLGPADQLRATPWVLQQQLVFPYTTGLEFACTQFLDGGWGAIDALYADPPTTTAQVLWPERFTAGEATVDVTDPVLPDGWDEVRRDQLGAADLLWLFQAPGDDRAAALSDAETRAQAWAGGELAVGTRGDDTVVGISLAQHPEATLALCDSVTSWYAAAFPGAEQAALPTGATTFSSGEQSAVIACDATEVHVGIGPDDETAALDQRPLTQGDRRSTRASWGRALAEYPAGSQSRGGTTVVGLSSYDPVRESSGTIPPPAGCGDPDHRQGTS